MTTKSYRMFEGKARKPARAEKTSLEQVSETRFASNAFDVSPFSVDSFLVFAAKIFYLSIDWPQEQ